MNEQTEASPTFRFHLPVTPTYVARPLRDRDCFPGRAARWGTAGYALEHAHGYPHHHGELQAELSRSRVTLAMAGTALNDDAAARRCEMRQSDICRMLHSGYQISSTA